MEQKKFIKLPSWILMWWMDGTNEEDAVKLLTEKGLMIDGHLTNNGNRIIAENFRIQRRQMKEGWHECAASRIGELSTKARSGNLAAKKELWEYIATVNDHLIREGREFRLSPADKSRIRDKIRGIIASYKKSPVQALDALLFTFQYELGQSQYDEISADDCYFFSEIGKKLVARYAFEQKQNVKFNSEDSRMEDVLVSMSEFAVQNLLERNQKRLLSFFKAKSEKKETL